MSEKPLLFPVLILAGGLATRLRPLTESIPKALVEVYGQPFITHQLLLLKSRGLERIVIAAGYRGEMIQDYVSDGSQFGLTVNYSFDGARLLGTAGAIKKALPLLDQDFFVIYGDSYLPCDYAAVQSAFIESDKTALMTIYHNNNLGDKSNVVYDGAQIVSYDKERSTPQMHYIDYGLSLFKKTAFASITDDQPSDLARLYQELLAQNELAAFEVKERFYENGSFEGLKELERYLKTIPK